MQLLWVAVVPKELDPRAEEMGSIQDGHRKTAMVDGTKR